MERWQLLEKEVLQGLFFFSKQKAIRVYRNNTSSRIVELRQAVSLSRIFFLNWDILTDFSKLRWGGGEEHAASRFVC